MTLLDRRFDPITREFGFIRIPYQTFANWREEWDGANMRPQGIAVSASRRGGSIEELLCSLLPLTSGERRRWLAVPTQSDWTAVFDNGFRGGDMASLSFPASTLGCEAVRVVTGVDVREKARREYGARMFELYVPQLQPGSHHCRRAISVCNDGGRWGIDLNGLPLPGEDPAWFEAKRVRDRFTEENLQTLLGHLGIDAFNPHFYRKEAILIERHGRRLVPGGRDFNTLAEAVRAFADAWP